MENTIEHHAVIMALLGKYAILYGREKGKKAFLDGIERVGKERGTRMAARAVQNGDELNFVNYIAYGEWAAKPGEMEAAFENESDETVLKVYKCPWHTAWSKHNLLEYGKYFCLPIDKALFSSFNYEFKCDIDSNLSWGADKCYFHWHQKLSDDDKKELAAKKAQLGQSCVKDFNYHTAHVIYSIGAELKKQLGKNGEKAVEDAKREFIQIFGKGFLEAAENLYPAKL